MKMAIKQIPLMMTFIALVLSVVALGDDSSPSISDLKVDPKVGSSGKRYRLTVKISDPQGAKDIVKTLFQLREGVEGIEVPIHDDGLDGDLSKGDGVYTGHSTVPRTAAKMTHLFKVYIEDISGHRSNVLEYQFTVVEKVKI